MQRLCFLKLVYFHKYSLNTYYVPAEDFFFFFTFNKRLLSLVGGIKQKYSFFFKKQESKYMTKCQMKGR